MLTDDKEKAGNNLSLNDNINTRDQRRALIWLIVLSVLALGSLVALGMQHVPQEHKKPTVADGTTAGNVLEFEDAHHSVRHSVGVLELPGHIGKDQSNRLKSQTIGNTPWTPEETAKLGQVAAQNAPAAADKGSAGAPAAGH